MRSQARRNVVRTLNSEYQADAMLKECCELLGKLVPMKEGRETVAKQCILSIAIGDNQKC